MLPFHNMDIIETDRTLLESHCTLAALDERLPPNATAAEQVYKGNLAPEHAGIREQAQKTASA